MKTLLCRYCHQSIYDRHAISGSKVEHWATEDNDFGCDANPISGEEGVGDHDPNFEDYFTEDASE